MTDFLSRFKIPTILGLSIIFLGLASGVYLVLQEQIFTSQAAPDLTPQNITLTNLTENSVTISWQTNTPASSFVTFGQENPTEQTALDDRDTAPKPHLIHYVTLKNLLPQARYQYKITSGKVTSELKSFETAKSLASQTGFTPIIGAALDDTAPVNEGIVYLSVTGAYLQSALIKTGGNFLIPLSYLRKNDLSDIYSLTEDATAKITIISNKGSASLITKLTANTLPLPSIKLGQSLDLTTPEETPPPNYDLNGDGKINSADNAIILQNFSNNPKNNKADLNKDGVVNQKDLDLMAQKLKDLGSR
ncbi:fibronectin type III domain-containing protein [Candidatus Daviesbacteria bacterium]|nr:fibronectin type III domain-containing protein [Candidatus Daviesbacteria bacterium]